MLDLRLKVFKIEIKNINILVVLINTAVGVLEVSRIKWRTRRRKI